MTDKEAMAKELEELAGKFSEGWHEGIKIDASDIMLLSQAAEVLAQPEPIQSLQCAHCQVTIETLNDKVMQLLAQRTEQEPVQETVPEGVITAIRNEGLTLVKNLQGYRLMRLGKVEAQATPPQRTEQEPVMVLPDGSAFGVMSFPLPDDHWLYAPNEYRDGEHEPIDLPKPVLTRPFRDAVVAAVR
jgi:hypothetical protein